MGGAAAKNAWIVPAIATMLLWAFWAFLPKVAAPMLSAPSFFVYSCIGALVAAIPGLVMVRFRPTFHARGTTFGLLTGLAGGVAAVLFFVSVALGPVSLVTAITAMHGSVTIVLARVLLRERLSRRQQLGVALAVISTALLCYNPQ